METDRELRIIFMGTPDFAVATLAKLIAHKYNIAGVITAPDRPAGRGRKLQESAVKKYARENELQVLQPTNLKNNEFLAQLKALNANLQIVVAFRMLPKLVWQMPKFGTFNLHASLLPHYRGAAPINWAIINGEKETGVTTFYIDEKIDTGEIILQSKTDIKEEDTAGTLHDRLMQLGAGLVLETVREIEQGNIVTKKQKHEEELKVAHKIDKTTCKIDWNQPLDDIYNHIRGLSPYPAAWTTLKNDGNSLFLKVYSASREIENHEYDVGQIISDKKTLKVAVKRGFLKLEEIQLPGKRKMNIKEVLNGLNVSDSAHVL